MHLHSGIDFCSLSQCLSVSSPSSSSSSSSASSSSSSSSCVRACVRACVCVLGKGGSEEWPNKVWRLSAVVMLLLCMLLVFEVTTRRLKAAHGEKQLSLLNASSKGIKSGTSRCGSFIVNVTYFQPARSVPRNHLHHFSVQSFGGVLIIMTMTVMNL